MRFHRRSKRAMKLALIVLMLAVVGLPPKPASAALRAEIPLADEGNSDFARGRFSMTGLVPPQKNAPKGGVQLLTLGTLQEVHGGLPPLCAPLAEMGTAAYTATLSTGEETTYFYTVGGRTNGPVEFPYACHARIINEQGMTTEWTQDAHQLPKPIYDNQAIALHTSSGGYLYSLGGRAWENGVELAQPHIYRAPIDDATGAVGEWVTPTLQLPEGRGLYNFALASHRTDAGDLYLYLLGGVRRWSAAGSNFYAYMSRVYSIQVGDNGEFIDTNGGNAGMWRREADIPVDFAPTCVGLHQAKAVTFPVYRQQADTTYVSPTLYLIGGIYEGSPAIGCDQPGTPSEDVYRAVFLENGALQWESDPGAATNEERNIDVLPVPLYGHQAVGFNQKIYVLGGYDEQSINPGPVKKVYGSYAQGDRDLAVDAETNTNFVQSGDIIPEALFKHGGNFGYYNDLPIFYIFGGRYSSDNSVGNDYLDTVYYAVPTEDEDSSQGYAGEGLYLSEVIDIEETVSPISVTWTTVISDINTDIQMSYRMANSPAGIYSAPWNTLDGDPTSPRHSQFNLTEPVTNSASTSGASGRYFQYRAKLTANQTNQSPILTAAHMKVEYNGFPNIVTSNASVIDPADGVLATLANTPPEGSSQPVLDANVDGTDGTFWVDMYIFEPGEEVITPTLTTSGASPEGDLYTEVRKSSLPANSSFSIPASSWLVNNTRYGTSGARVDWGSAFRTSGEYTILIVVDSAGPTDSGGAGLIVEGDTLDSPGEQDNIFGFSYDFSGGAQYLPAIYY